MNALPAEDYLQAQPVTKVYRPSGPECWFSMGAGSSCRPAHLGALARGHGPEAPATPGGAVWGAFAPPLGAFLLGVPSSPLWGPFFSPQGWPRRGRGGVGLEI